MTINDWKQANTDLALVQAGSAGVSRAAFVLGAKTGRPTLHEWDSVRWSLLSNNPDYVAFWDDFLGDSVNATWQPDLSTGSTIAINTQNGGAIRFTTDTDDDDHATLTLGLHWLVSNGWTFFETRFKSVSAITVRAIEIGLSDAISETNGLAFSNHSVAGITAVADDAAIFGYDTDATMTTWAANSVNAAGTPQATLLTAAPTTSYVRLGIAVNDGGDAFYFVDGDLVATHTSAVATTAVLTPWISLKSLSAATKSIDIDYAAIAGAR
jgi:hypothetical protein